MSLEVSIPQICKVRPTPKMGSISQVIQLFHLESTEVDGNFYMIRFGSHKVKQSNF